MTDYPIEQAQCDRALAPFRRGLVLVGGLGLGYAATALALRPAVRIVAVEKSQDVVYLVAPHLLAGDPAARARLTVIRVDLFAYLRSLPARRRPTFDRAFYDVWASDGERTFFGAVVPLLRLSAGRVRARPVCWNEDVMRGQLYFSLVGRWGALSSPHRGALTVDELCEPRGTVWVDWSVPFFRWARRAAPDASRLQEMAALYAGWYGLGSFPDTWEAVAGERVPDLDTSALEKEVLGDP